MSGCILCDGQFRYTQLGSRRLQLRHCTLHSRTVSPVLAHGCGMRCRVWSVGIPSTWVITHPSTMDASGFCARVQWGDAAPWGEHSSLPIMEVLCPLCGWCYDESTVDRSYARRLFSSSSTLSRPSLRFPQTLTFPFTLYADAHDTTAFSPWLS
jgi:hypothetical protein